MKLWSIPLLLSSLHCVIILCVTATDDVKDDEKSVLKKKADIHLVVSAGDSGQTKVVTIPLDAHRGSSGGNPPTYVYPPTRVDLYSRTPSSSSSVMATNSKSNNNRAPHSEDRMNNARERDIASKPKYRDPVAQRPSSASDLFRKQQRESSQVHDMKLKSGAVYKYERPEANGPYFYSSNEVRVPLGHREKQGNFGGRANWKPLHQSYDKNNHHQEGRSETVKVNESPEVKPLSNPRSSDHETSGNTNVMSREYPGKYYHDENHHHGSHTLEETSEDTTRVLSVQNRPHQYSESEYIPKYYEPRPSEMLPTEENQEDQPPRIISLPPSTSANQNREIPMDETRMMGLSHPVSNNGNRVTVTRHYHRDYEVQEQPPHRKQIDHEEPHRNYRLIRVPVDYENSRNKPQYHIQNQYEYHHRRIPNHHEHETRHYQGDRYFEAQQPRHPRQYQQPETYYRTKPTYHDNDYDNRPRFVQHSLPQPIRFEQTPRYRHQQFVEESRHFPASVQFYQQGQEQHHQHEMFLDRRPNQDHELDVSDSISTPVFALPPPTPNSLPRHMLPRPVRRPMGLPNQVVPINPNGIQAQNGLKVVRLPYNVIRNIMSGESHVDVLNLK